MTKHVGGTKRSSWLTFRRRLLLVRLLLRGPAAAADLITTVQTTLGSDGYPSAAAAALKHDFDSLKSEYDCEITFHRETGTYTLDDLGALALLDLPDESMEALSLLDASYPAGAGLPEQASVRRLLDRIELLLPEAQREQRRNRRQATNRGPNAKPPGRIDATVLTTVKKAIDAQQELAFRYWSPFDVDAPRRHRVAPYAIVFRPEGHGYLDATLLDVSPAGGETALSAVDYRLDRIVPGTLQILAQALPAERPQPRTYRLRYRLLAGAARRRDVTAYFPNSQVMYHEDGEATVTATVTNLLQARQVLLRYGTSCQVSEPPELIALFREATRGFCELYDIPIAATPAPAAPEVVVAPTPVEAESPRPRRTATPRKR